MAQAGAVGNARCRHQFVPRQHGALGLAVAQRKSVPASRLAPLLLFGDRHARRDGQPSQEPQTEKHGKNRKAEVPGRGNSECANPEEDDGIDN